MILNIFITGLTILVGAIILNIIAQQLKILTWYGFFEKMQKKGLGKAFRSLKAVEVLFLFILYPLALGYLASLGL